VIGGRMIEYNGAWLMTSGLLVPQDAITASVTYANAGRWARKMDCRDRQSRWQLRQTYN